MAISANYQTPVWVNGYLCRNCTDVGNAKKHIDPAHPKSGPYNIDAKTDPTRALQNSVTFGGSLNAPAPNATASAPTPQTVGSLLDIAA